MLKREVFLPKVYKGDNEKYKGKPMISWSQIETWNSKSGFNTGMEGFLEYMLKYFIGASFPDMGWGTFGSEVEDYICIREHAEKFNDEEKKVMDTIIPLGVFQQEVVIDFGEFVVLGFIDDADKAFELIRDYKTKSESSKKDLHKPEKHQLDIYAMWVRQEFGHIPKAEYCVIERLGGKECMSGGGRAVLTIGKQIWYEPYKEITDESLALTEALVRRTVYEISSYYRTYTKIFGEIEVPDVPEIEV